MGNCTRWTHNVFCLVGPFLTSDFWERFDQVVPNVHVKLPFWPHKMAPKGFVVTITHSIYKWNEMSYKELTYQRLDYESF